MAAGSLPANFNTVVVSAFYLSFDGQPVQGTVTFTPSINFLTDPSAAAIILAKPIIGKVVDGHLLNADGSGPLRLFATDDPDVSLQGWTYSVKEALTGGSGRPDFSISVPVVAVDYGLDLWNLAPATVVPVPVDQPASVAALAGLQAQVDALSNGGPVRVVRVPPGGTIPPRPAGALVVFWYSSTDPGDAAVSETDFWIPTTT